VFSGSIARKIAVRSSIAAGAATLAMTMMSVPAHAGGWQKVGNNELVYVKDGKCKSAGRIQNLYPNYASASSQLEKGKCWHWIKLWVVQPKFGRWQVLVNQGTKRTNFVFAQPAWDPARHNKGWYGYRAEIGLCGSKGHCVKKYIQVPHWGN
jgi:hypothetical protein